MDRCRHHAAAGRHPPRGVGLRQVWKALTSSYLNPGGGARWRVWGGAGKGEGDRLIPLLPSAGMRRKARARRSRSAPSRYVTPAWRRDRKSPPRSVGGLRVGRVPFSSLWGLLLPWRFLFCFVFARSGCLGVWGVQERNLGFGALEVAVVHGRGSFFLTPRRGAVPLPIICSYFWRLKGLESDRQPSEPPFPSPPSS